MLLGKSANKNSMAAIAASSLLSIPFAALIPLGSYVTVFYFVAAAACLALIFLKPVPHGLYMDTRVVSRIIVGYWLVTAAIVLLNYRAFNDLRYLYNNLGMLVFPLLLYSLHRIPYRAVIRRAADLAAAGNVVGLVMALYQHYNLHERAQAGMGNSLIFGAAAVVLSFLCMAGLNKLSIRHMCLRTLGIAAGFYCVWLTQSRGVIVAVPLLLAAYVFCYGINSHSRSAKWVMIGMLLLCMAPSLKLGNLWLHRFNLIAYDLSDMNEAALAKGPTGVRLLYYKYGLQIFSEHPLTGVGRQNTMAMTYAAMPPGARMELLATEGGSDSHLHNEYVTTLASYGVVGLAALLLLYAAPVIIALKARGIPGHEDRMFIAMITSIGYMCFGLSNLTFGHDLSNVVFLFMVLLVAADAVQQRKAEGMS